ncbi:hypothetical protein MO973_40090 [Paenibacillus sp. TRM 82003]|uniref:hypothetical protein n=1 Tax=Kineococcus sp. TRM81007 TaxID=2925831 RepID=UPI001F56E9B8|nr:hypothetical protein [Kineococcus sp. TRM81007]MCI2237127.1 hypothetical protein [Kineococcus sp. TRM81007]MCI3926402.1 hypothetical protein [Paenibacillus sp. TRM 82003]
MLPRTAAAHRAATAPVGVVHALWVRPARLLWWVERGGPPAERGTGTAPGGVHPAALDGGQRVELLRSGLAGEALHAVLAGPTRWVPALVPARDGVPVPGPDAFARVPVPRRHPAPVELAVVHLPCTAPALAVSVDALRRVGRSGRSGGGLLVPGREVLRLAALVRDLAAFAAADPAGRGGPGLRWRRRWAATLPAVLRSAVGPDGDRPALGAQQVVDDVAAAVLPHLRRDRLPAPAAATARVVLLLGGSAADGWCVDVTLSVGGAAPLRIGELTGDPLALEALRAGLARAVRVCPPLRAAARDGTDPGRLRLPAAVAAELAGRELELLHGAGVALLAPREVLAALAAVRRPRQLQSKRWIRQASHPSHRRRWGGSA